MIKVRIPLVVFVICFAHLLTTSVFAQDCNNIGGQITVTNTNDSGPGSFRQAIVCANATLGGNIIEFDIPGAGPHVINVGATTSQSLQPLLDPGTIIDGRTQNGYVNSPLIILDGGNGIWTNPINAIWIRANFCEVYGLEIRNFPDDGIDLRTADNITIQENYIHDNGYETDFFPGAPGTGPWNGCGLVIREGSDNIKVDGNVIENNEFCGIVIRNGAINAEIGVAQRNIIKDNAAGIIVGANSFGIRMQENELLCNDTLGIEVESGANGGQSPPVITDAFDFQISGTGQSGHSVEVFISDNNSCVGAVCQGSIWLGTATVSNGNWALSLPFQSGLSLNGDEVITATMTDEIGNTSAYSNCKVVIGTSACTEDNGDIIVKNTLDEGTGSLRAAILCANQTPGANTIRFEIPGDTVHTIYVGSQNNSALPALLDEATVIDATTQTGFGTDGAYSPKIRLDGSQANWTAPINAVWVRADFCEIYGLEIVNFPDDGIDLTGADYVKVGDINKGNVLYSNGSEIDFWPDAPGTGPWNACGIVLKQGSDFAEVKGNILGTNYSESIAASNELCGIIVQNGGDNNQIEQNVIAHHKLGVRIDNGGTRNTLSRNKFYCNDSIPVLLNGSANLFQAAPIIESASTISISGKADSADVVEVFISADGDCAGLPCQGKVYLGTVTVLDSLWTLDAPFFNDVLLNDSQFVTATATDFQGNTSVFSTCSMVENICDVMVAANVQATSCGLNNGGFDLETSGGTEPYQVQIGSGIVSGTSFENLASGTYFITITDANVCEATTTVVIDDSTAPQGFVVDLASASCGENNGSFSINASEGLAPYTYDIGAGATAENSFENLSGGAYIVTITDANGCTDEVNVMIEQSGIPQGSILETSDEVCEMGNGAILVEATGGMAPYTFDLGNGAQSSPVFDDLTAGGYLITAIDAAGCSTMFGGVVEASGTLTQADFSYSVTDGLATFTNASTVGETYDWDFGDGGISVLENPMHVYEESGIYEVCLTVNNECGADEFCEMIAIEIPLALVNIGGRMAKENGQAVALVEVNNSMFPLQTTVLDGEYLFEDLGQGSNLEIVPSRDFNYRNGVTTFDLFLVNQHILGFSFLDSPYKIIAADVNRSGSVTTIDLVRMQQLVLFVSETFPNNTSWRFIPADYEFVNPLNPFPEDFPEQINLMNIMENDLNQDFIAVKVGDVNLSSNPNAFDGPGGETEFSITKIKTSPNETTLKFRSEQRTKISAFEMSFELDPGKLKFLEVVASEVGVQPEFFYHEAKNRLHLSWFDPKGIGQEDLSFQLRFQNHSEDWSEGIRLSEGLEPRTFDLSGMETKIKLNFLDTETLTHRVVPNPFDEETSIQVESEQSRMMLLQIFDVNGTVVFSEKARLERGVQRINVNMKGLPSGVYFYQLGNEHGTLVKE